jgi:putative transposase
VNQMTKAVLERALEAEMTHELGYQRGDPAGHGSGNSRRWSFDEDGFDVERGR